ncbi:MULTISPECIES: 3-hydroxybutyrate dehydrogenase [unclassified Halomonas]|uniref:3-hydroxybutyrate dehydrogenase n=1 Tax=unclassified Halomonas TaxID=2609666 RepID=UPI003FDA1ECA
MSTNTTINSVPKNILVTGALGGIGRAICLQFAREGYCIIAHDISDVHNSNVKDFLQELENEGAVGAHYYKADLKQLSQVDGLFDALQADGLHVDILVNNAGIQQTAPIAEFNEQMWSDILAINLTAVYRCIQHSVADMRYAGWGRIINLSSVHGLVGSANKAAYVAAKHGVVGLTKVIALETATQNITVNAISPGWTDTPILDPQIEQRMAQLGSTRDDAIYNLVAEKQPTGKLVPPEHVAALVYFLVGEQASHITGGTLPIDGGWTCQ